MNSKNYTIIVPAIDATGPVNVAFDLGRAAAQRDWRVRVLYLSNHGKRTDTDFAHEVRKFKVSDLWQLSGVVHTHCLRPVLLGWLISWSRRCLLVTTLHNFFLLELRFGYHPVYIWFAWQMWQRALRRYVSVVCISNAMKRYYERILPNQRFFLARNFRDAPPTGTQLDEHLLEWFNQQHVDGLRIIAYVGSLSPRKNVLALIEAMPVCKDVALLLCGTGPDRDTLGRRVTELDLLSRVHFAGQLTAPTAALSKVDALILPSFAEGFPLVVLEAASVGVPSLLSNIAVHRELSGLGFGATFDHRRFSDFSIQLTKLLASHPSPDQRLQTLWQTEYSSDAGFARYEAIFTQMQ